MSRGQQSHFHARVFGPRRSSSQPASCGLCGELAILSKAHVPPRCAGNNHLVTRRRLWIQGEGSPLQRTRRKDGGLWVYGLCADCNNLASKYDSAYAELARGLRSLWRRGDRLLLPLTVDLPRLQVRPGGVARSLLIGMTALNPNIRATHPGLTDALLTGGSARLPGDLQLRIALHWSDSARVFGAVSGTLLLAPASDKVNRLAPGVNYQAGIYFPPLAWALAWKESPLLDRHRYADASSWLSHDPAEVVDLHDLVQKLPYVRYPGHDPDFQRLGWSEIWADEIAEIVETDDLPRQMLLDPT